MKLKFAQELLWRDVKNWKIYKLEKKLKIKNKVGKESGLLSEKKKQYWELKEKLKDKKKRKIDEK